MLKVSDYHGYWRYCVLLFSHQHTKRHWHRWLSKILLDSKPARGVATYRKSRKRTTLSVSCKKKKRKKARRSLAAIVARRCDYALVVHVLWQLAVGRQLFSSPSFAEFSPLDMLEHDLPERLQSHRNRYQYDASVSAAVCHVDGLSLSTAPCPVALFDSVYFKVSRSDCYTFFSQSQHVFISSCLHRGSCFLVRYRRLWFPSVHSEDGRSW